MVIFKPKDEKDWWELVSLPPPEQWPAAVQAHPQATALVRIMHAFQEVHAIKLRAIGSVTLVQSGIDPEQWDFLVDASIRFPASVIKVLDTLNAANSTRPTQAVADLIGGLDVEMPLAPASRETMRAALMPIIANMVEPSIAAWLSSHRLALELPASPALPRPRI